MAKLILVLWNADPAQELVAQYSGSASDNVSKVFDHIIQEGKKWHDACVARGVKMKPFSSAIYNFYVSVLDPAAAQSEPYSGYSIYVNDGPDRYLLVDD